MQNNKNISNWQEMLYVVTKALDKIKIEYEIIEDNEGAFIQDKMLNFTIVVLETNHVVFEAHTLANPAFIALISLYLIQKGIKVDGVGLQHQPDDELFFGNEAEEKRTEIITKGLGEINCDYDEMIHNPIDDVTVH